MKIQRHRITISIQNFDTRKAAIITLKGRKGAFRAASTAILDILEGITDAREEKRTLPQLESILPPAILKVASEFHIPPFDLMHRVGGPAEEPLIRSVAQRLVQERETSQFITEIAGVRGLNPDLLTKRLSKTASEAEIIAAAHDIDVNPKP